MHVQRQKSVAGWLGAVASVAAAWMAWSMLSVGTAAQAKPDREDVKRPAGWNPATHGETVRPDYPRLFAMDTVHELRIVIAADQFRAMQDDLRVRDRGPGREFGRFDMSRDPIYVPVTVRHDARTWTRVGMRYKGKQSLEAAATSGNGKIPFRLDFDRYEDEFPEIRNQRFYGFRELTFSSNSGDDSQIREAFSKEVFRDRGVPAPRAAFYRVFVDTGNGSEYWGLYTMIEDPADGAMLETQFGGRGGNLYKPGMGPVFPGANWAQFHKESFPKKTNRKQADFSDVEAAITALHAQPGPGNLTWRTALEARFDADLFLRWLAVNTAIYSSDAYGSLAHNYYLYGDPGQQGRLRWIPWDNNQAFRADPGELVGPEQRADSARRRSDVLHTQAGSRWPLISLLLADDVYAAQYREHLTHALEGLFAPEASVARMRQMHALIASSVVGERGERPSHTTISLREAFERAIDGPGGLKEIAERRHEIVRQALAAATNR